MTCWNSRAAVDGPGIANTVRSKVVDEHVDRALDVWAWRPAAVTGADVCVSMRGGHGCFLPVVVEVDAVGPDPDIVRANDDLRGAGQYFHGAIVGPHIKEPSVFFAIIFFNGTILEDDPAHVLCVCRSGKGVAVKRIGVYSYFTAGKLGH